jgi:tetratricopeptide (TPR) repeat protein
LLSAQRYSEAADCYQRALAIDPDYLLAQKRLSDVQRILQHIR